MKLFIKWNSPVGGVHYIIYCGCSNSGIPRAQTWRPIWQSSHGLSSPPQPHPRKGKRMIYIFTPLETRPNATHTTSISVRRRYDIILYSAFWTLQQILSERNLVDHVWRRTSYNNNNNNNNTYCTLYIYALREPHKRSYTSYTRDGETRHCSRRYNVVRVKYFYTIHMCRVYIYIYVCVTGFTPSSTMCRAKDIVVLLLYYYYYYDDVGPAGDTTCTRRVRILHNSLSIFRGSV